MARQHIGGQVKSKPHNDNYEELYDITDDLTNEVINIKHTAVRLLTKNVTIEGDGTSYIEHNLSYNPATDELQVIYYTLLLEKDVNYIEHENNRAITLLDWSIDTGETVYFKLYKNVISE